MTRSLFMLLLTCGLCVRLVQYIHNRSLFLDEAALASSVVQRPLGRLFILPLSYGQQAPFGFLLLAKLSTLLLGNTDAALRLVPLIFSLLTLPVSYLLSLRAFSCAVAQLCFLGLVCFSPILVYYSSDFKQYSLDVFASVLLLWLAERFQNQKVGPLLFILVGQFVVWFSQPSIFVLAAIALSLCVEKIGSGFKALQPLLLIIVGWVVSFVIVFWLTFPSASMRKSLAAYWSIGFAPLPMHSVTELRWYWETALGLIYLSFFQSVVLLPSSKPGWFGWLNISLLMVTVAGIFALFSNAKRFFRLFVFTCGVTFLASLLHLYPFRDRLILFLTPLVFLAVGGVVDWAAAQWNRYMQWGAKMGAVFLVSLVAIPSIKILFAPHNNYDIKSVLAYIQAHRATNDALALSQWSEPAFRFYAKQFHLGDMRVNLRIPPANDPNRFLQTLCQQQAFGRTWVIFSHRFDERKRFLARLRSLLPEADSWEGGGAGTYLFNFSPVICASLRTP